MKVVDVLRYLGKSGNRLLSLKQYLLKGCTIEGEGKHFLLASEVKEKIGERLFRVMECDVITYMVEN